MSGSRAVNAKPIPGYITNQILSEWIMISKLPDDKRKADNGRILSLGKYADETALAEANVSIIEVMDFIRLSAVKLSPQSRSMRMGWIQPVTMYLWFSLAYGGLNNKEKLNKYVTQSGLSKADYPFPGDTDTVQMIHSKTVFGKDRNFMRMIICHMKTAVPPTLIGLGGIVQQCEYYSMTSLVTTRMEGILSNRQRTHDYRNCWINHCSKTRSIRRVWNPRRKGSNCWIQIQEIGESGKLGMHRHPRK